MYWDWRGRIFNFLNKSRQESSLPEFIIILIILFFILNMSLLWVDTPQIMIPYGIMELDYWEIDHFWCLKRQKWFQGSDYKDILFSFGIIWSIWQCHDKLFSITNPKIIVLCILEICLLSYDMCRSVAFVFLVKNWRK